MSLIGHPKSTYLCLTWHSSAAWNTTASLLGGQGYSDASYKTPNLLPILCLRRIVIMAGLKISQKFRAFLFCRDVSKVLGRKLSASSVARFLSRRMRKWNPAGARNIEWMRSRPRQNLEAIQSCYTRDSTGACSCLRLRHPSTRNAPHPNRADKTIRRSVQGGPTLTELNVDVTRLDTT